MTKVDERSPVPDVDAAARRRLAKALDREGVVAGYLIGSQASGRAGPLSDVDVAAWVDPVLDAARRADLRMTLLGAAVRALETSEVDLVVLNDAPPLIRHDAVANGERLVERDRAARIRLETSALLEYLDTGQLRRLLADGRRQRLAEGRFGRR